MIIYSWGWVLFVILAIMPVRCNGRKKYYMISGSVNMEQIHLI